MANLPAHAPVTSKAEVWGDLAELEAAWRRNWGKGEARDVRLGRQEIRETNRYVTSWSNMRFDGRVNR